MQLGRSRARKSAGPTKRIVDALGQSISFGQDVVLVAPFFVAALTVWSNLPPTELAKWTFLGTLELGVMTAFYRVLVTRVLHRLDLRADSNARRLDGTLSRHRERIEIRALRRLKFDLLGSLLLVTVFANLLIFSGSYLLLEQTLPDLPALNPQPTWFGFLWIVLWALAMATILMARITGFAIQKFKADLQRRSREYRQRDLTRLHDSYLEAENASESRDGNSLAGLGPKTPKLR